MNVNDETDVTAWFVILLVRTCQGLHLSPPIQTDSVR